MAETNLTTVMTATTLATSTADNKATEAEAALLALGPQLEWMRHGERWSSAAPSDASGKTEGDEYWVGPDKDKRRKTFQAHLVLVSALGSTDTSPHRYKALNDAKAACERHNVTGEWT